MLSPPLVLTSKLKDSTLAEDEFDGYLPADPIAKQGHREPAAQPSKQSVFESTENAKKPSMKESIEKLNSPPKRKGKYKLHTKTIQSEKIGVCAYLHIFSNIPRGVCKWSKHWELHINTLFLPCGIVKDYFVVGQTVISTFKLFFLLVSILFLKIQNLHYAMYTLNLLKLIFLFIGRSEVARRGKILLRNCHEGRSDQGIFYMVIGDIQIYKFNTFFNTGVMNQG